MDADVESFVKSCVRCLFLCTENIVLHPLGYASHAAKLNELLHFDFCYIMPFEGDKCYLIILTNDKSSYVRLLATKKTGAKVVADELLCWFSSFGAVQRWVSNRGSHFQKELI